MPTYLMYVPLPHSLKPCPYAVVLPVCSHTFLVSQASFPSRSQATLSYVLKRCTLHAPLCMCIELPKCRNLSVSHVQGISPLSLTHSTVKPQTLNCPASLTQPLSIRPSDPHCSASLTQPLSLTPTTIKPHSLNH